MNIEIIHKETKSIRVVKELSDLLFDDGWRFLRNVSESKTYGEVLKSNDEMNSRRENNFTKGLNENDFSYEIELSRKHIIMGIQP